MGVFTHCAIIFLAVLAIGFFFLPYLLKAVLSACYIGNFKPNVHFRLNFESVWALKSMSDEVEVLATVTVAILHAPVLPIWRFSWTF